MLDASVCLKSTCGPSSHSLEKTWTQIITFKTDLVSHSMAFASYRSSIGRVRTVLRMLPSPALRDFECHAVRDVRNHLLEHPEGRTSGVITGGFGFGGGVGPALKYGRPTRMPEMFADSGLYANADQYRRS